MTKTARDLRSAAHALRTAANALEETVTALRALSDDLNVPDPEPAPEPAPAWPTAPHVWHDGEVWTRLPDGSYTTRYISWAEGELQSTFEHVRDVIARFAREAAPVTLVPTEAWKSATRDLDYTPDCELIDAVDSLAREVGE